MKYNLGGYLYTPVTGKKRQYLHRQVAEKALGRPLTKKECVHHINYDKTDNRNENLVVCDLAYHNMLHARTDTLNAGFDPNIYQWCSHHKAYEPMVSFGVGNGYRDKSGVCLAARKELKIRTWEKAT